MVKLYHNLNKWTLLITITKERNLLKIYSLKRLKISWRMIVVLKRVAVFKMIMDFNLLLWVMMRLNLNDINMWCYFLKPVGTPLLHEYLLMIVSRDLNEIQNFYIKINFFKEKRISRKETILNWLYWRWFPLKIWLFFI